MVFFCILHCFVGKLVFLLWFTLFCPIAQLDRNGNFIIITLDENCPQIMRKLILRQIAYWRPFFEVKILCFQISHPQGTHCISQSLRKRDWSDEGGRVSQAFSNSTSCIEHSIVGRVRRSLASINACLPSSECSEVCSTGGGDSIAAAHRGLQLLHNNQHPIEWLK